MLRRRRLRWFGHVKRRDMEDSLRRVGELVVEGRCPPGRPKKSWKRTVEEDVRVVGARKTPWTEIDGEASSNVKLLAGGKYNVKRRK